LGGVYLWVVGCGELVIISGFAGYRVVGRIAVNLQVIRGVTVVRETQV
ncbi:MAG: hypothetical protein EZS28_032052, partial [Streblomastix strix]